jgi:hypothetical protein
MRYEWAMAPSLGRFEPLVWWVGRLAIGVAIVAGVVGIWRPWATAVGACGLALLATSMFFELRGRTQARR